VTASNSNKITVANIGYKQKACHNFCLLPGQLHHDSKFNAVYQFRKTGSGQFLLPGQFYHSPGWPAYVKTSAVKAKIAPWCLASRDPSLRSGLLAKEPGPVTGWTAPPTLSAHTRNR
jgi:hypothetical protein